MIERPAGAVKPAAAPLMKRAAIRSGPLSTSAPSSDATREHGERDDQHALAPEQVGGAAAEQQQAAVAEHVAADDPLQGRGGEVEVGVDAGEGNADHGDVESVEEQDAAQNEERDPRPAGRKAGESAVGEGTFMTRQYMQSANILSKLIHTHGPDTMRAVTQARDRQRIRSTAWRALNAAHAAVHAALEHELRREHDLSTIEYEVLDRLGECADGQGRACRSSPRPSTPRRARSRASSRGSRTRGWRSRAMCSDDRRGIFASLTDTGRARLDAAGRRTGARHRVDARARLTAAVRLLSSSAAYD